MILLVIWSPLQIGIFIYVIFKVKKYVNDPIFVPSWVGIILVFGIFLGLFMFLPIIKWTIDIDDFILQVLVVVIIFPMFREIMYAALRRCCALLYRNNDERVALILIGFQFCACLASRLLLTTMKSLQTVIYSTLALGFIEIFLRQTFMYRDKLWFSFFHSKEATNRQFNSKKYKSFCGLIIICEVLSELIGIIYSHILIAISVAGVFDESRCHFYFGQEVGMEYDVTKLVLSCIFQLIIEFSVDLICIQVEQTVLHIPVMRSWQNIPKNFVFYVMYVTYICADMLSECFTQSKCGDYDMSNYTMNMNLCEYCPEKTMNNDLWYICFGSSFSANTTTSTTFATIKC